MNQPVRIGTRNSPLALWQAQHVKDFLARKNVKAELILYSSAGDQNLYIPLNELNAVGAFTRKIDEAVKAGEVDLAVHSLKDLPTSLDSKLDLIATPKRASPWDVLVRSNIWNQSNAMSSERKIATGSLRRKAQWLSRFPSDEIVGLRGNVGTRLKRLNSSSWYGAIFAQAGLERVDLLPESSEVLDWMIPAPAQGIIGVVGRKNRIDLKDFLEGFHHRPTYYASLIERSFLQTLEGGCAAPVGAHYQKKDNHWSFTAGLYRLDGSQAWEIRETGQGECSEHQSRQWARDLLNSDAGAYIQELRNSQSIG